MAGGDGVFIRAKYLFHRSMPFRGTRLSISLYAKPKRLAQRERALVIPATEVCYLK